MYWISSRGQPASGDTTALGLAEGGGGYILRNGTQSLGLGLVLCSDLRNG